MSQMDLFMYFMEERKQMIEELLTMCRELLDRHRELQIKYLKLWYDTKSSNKSH